MVKMARVRFYAVETDFLENKARSRIDRTVNGKRQNFDQWKKGLNFEVWIKIKIKKRLGEGLIELNEGKGSRK